jgi:hypothetical protein
MPKGDFFNISGQKCLKNDTNGGLVYSHLQNSTTAGDILTKLGMLVVNKMLEDRYTCFLSGVSILNVLYQFNYS